MADDNLEDENDISVNANANENTHEIVSSDSAVSRRHLEGAFKNNILYPNIAVAAEKPEFELRTDYRITAVLEKLTETQKKFCPPGIQVIEVDGYIKGCLHSYSSNNLVIQENEDKKEYYRYQLEARQRKINFLNFFLSFKFYAGLLSLFLAISEVIVGDLPGLGTVIIGLLFYLFAAIKHVFQDCSRENYAEIRQEMVKNEIEDYNASLSNHFKRVDFFSNNKLDSKGYSLFNPLDKPDIFWSRCSKALFGICLIGAITAYGFTFYQVVTDDPTSHRPLIGRNPSTITILVATLSMLGILGERATELIAGANVERIIEACEDTLLLFKQIPLANTLHHHANESKILIAINHLRRSTETICSYMSIAWPTLFPLQRLANSLPFFRQEKEKERLVNLVDLWAEDTIYYPDDDLAAFEDARLLNKSN